MKPRIFIGSSSEGLAMANHIKTRLSTFADCQIWNEGFFQANRSSFESLSEGAVLFDFAMLVASADDVTLKRGSLVTAARDNVLLEFGLYLGRIGRNRAYFLREHNLDLPSDLFGITLDEYKTTVTDPGKTIDEVCDDLITRMSEVWNTFELSFVPSTTLAVGYFENFVSHVSRELMEPAKRVANGNNYSDFKLHIAIPSALPNNFRDQVIDYLHATKLDRIEVHTLTRPYNFYLDVSPASFDVLDLYDMPTTLSALKGAVELAIPKGYVGEKERERILHIKELNNFCRTLDYLIKENPITKNRVDITMINVS